MFHRIHIPLGILLIAAGLVHGLFAGNPLGTTFRQASFGKILFTWKAEENAKMDDSENLVTFSGAILKDGTYEGAADGYARVIKVSVVVENGAVTDISIVEENDTPQFFEYAKGIIKLKENSAWLGLLKERIVKMHDSNMQMSICPFRE